MVQKVHLRTRSLSAQENLYCEGFFHWLQIQEFYHPGEVCDKNQGYFRFGTVDLSLKWVQYPFEKGS